MGKSVNQVTLLGRLVQDTELKSTTSGKNVTSFTLAVDKVGKDGGADFFDVTAWDKLAELTSQYTKKGSKVLVLGRLQQRQWEQDGQKRYKIEVVAYDITFLDPKDSAGEDTVHEVSDEPINLDEIPF